MTFSGEDLYKYAREHDTLLQVKCSKRLYRCTAWLYVDYDLYLVWLRSYGTIVACFDCASQELHRFGRYSATTYQHYRKFRNWLFENMYAPNSEKPWEITEVQHEFENWYQ